MKVTRMISLITVLALIAPALFAGGLWKYKGWDSSPQGYFMTNAERQQWATIRTDTEAEQFVATFLASRDPGFAAEVALRAGQADKNFTAGSIPGSRTLRGKLIVLLGVPSGMDIKSELDKDGVHHDSPMMAAALSGGSMSGTGSGGRDSGGVDGNEGAKTMGVAKVIRYYHFTYASTPAGPLDVVIFLDENNGKDRARSREDSKQLDAAFEAAAQASIKKK